MVELEGLGCEVEIVACDVADRSQLEEVITGIPAACPFDDGGARGGGA